MLICSSLVSLQQRAQINHMAQTIYNKLHPRLQRYRQLYTYDRDKKNFEKSMIHVLQDKYGTYI